MITARDITVVFKRGIRRKPLKALDQLNIAVNRGDVFGLLGPNGAGKSTALYVFLGLIRPTEGRIEIDGEEPVPGSALFDRIAYVPEEPHYHLYLTVQEALRYYARLYRVEVSNVRMREAIDRVGLGDFRDLRLDRCSKGMKQKLGIATCLIRRPDWVFLDEPTRGLDPVIVKEFRDIILDMNRQGTTFVINSHILSEMEMVCNRVAILNRGRLIAQDELRRLMKYDLETYVIEVGIPDGCRLPDWIQVTPPLHGISRGTVEASRLGEFFKVTSEMKIQVFSCSLKRMTLEEAFFSFLNKETSG